MAPRAPGWGALFLAPRAPRPAPLTALTDMTLRALTAANDCHPEVEGGGEVGWARTGACGSGRAAPRRSLPLRWGSPGPCKAQRQAGAANTDAGEPTLSLCLSFSDLPLEIGGRETERKRDREKERQRDRGIER